MYRRYELPPEQGRPYLYQGDMSAGMATEPPGCGDTVTYRVGGLAVFDLVVEAVGDGTVQGVVVDYRGHFVKAFPRIFDRADRLEVATAAIWLIRRA